MSSNSMNINNNEDIIASSKSQDVSSENRLSVDSILNALRSKLQAGHGECIYKLVDPSKCIFEIEIP